MPIILITAFPRDHVRRQASSKVPSRCSQSRSTAAAWSIASSAPCRFRRSPSSRPTRNKCSCTFGPRAPRSLMAWASETLMVRKTMMSLCVARFNGRAELTVDRSPERTRRALRRVDDPIRLSGVFIRTLRRRLALAGRGTGKPRLVHRSDPRRKQRAPGGRSGRARPAQQARGDGEGIALANSVHAANGRPRTGTRSGARSRQARPRSGSPSRCPHAPRRVRGSGAEGWRTAGCRRATRPAWCPARRSRRRCRAGAARGNMADRA